jgi:hypothetical protein
MRIDQYWQVTLYCHKIILMITTESIKYDSYAAIARQRLGKHASAAKDTHVTTEKPLDAMLSMRSMLRLCSKDGRESVG